MSVPGMRKLSPPGDWVQRLAIELGRRRGQAPVARPLGKVPGLSPADHPVWWTANDADLAVGISAADAALLPELLGEAETGGATLFTQLMNTAHDRSGETGAAPAGAAVMDAWELALPPSTNIRLFLADRHSNLEALMDIEMPVTLRFGSTHLLLQDILALDAGSIVEFDGMADDPVEVLVNGRVVARGEAVTVDGSYGVRIMEVASPNERLGSSVLAG